MKSSKTQIRVLIMRIQSKLILTITVNPMKLPAVQSLKQTLKKHNKE